MQLGVRAHDYGRSPAEQLFARISADGFSTVQLACQKAITGIDRLSDVTPELISNISKLLTFNQLSVGVYGSYVELGLADEPARKAQAAAFLSQLTNARALHASCIGSETTATAKQPEVPRAQAMAALRKSLEEILPEAERLGVTVAIEPVSDHTLHTPEAAAALLREMKSPFLKLIFDPVNLITAELLPRQRELWDRAFDCFENHIAAVHIKGTRIGAQGSQEKCSLPESQIDWEYLAPRLRKFNNALPVLREEAVPAQAQSDLQYLKALFGELPAS